MPADRRALLASFRSRLGEVIQHSGLTRGQFAAMTGIDRSTVSQLLAPDNRRLPRVETLTDLAETHQVSIDWLMGLTQGGPMRAEVVHETMTFAVGSRAEHDERLKAWFAEAVGYKVRHVPATLPDLLKSDAVITYELRQYVASSPAQKMEAAAESLAWTRGPETDMEICSSRQSIEGFARGEGIWSGLGRAERQAQLDRMIALTDELYPTLRWFLFDGLSRYAAPVTIFGPVRAALYLGQMYLVLTSTEHVRVLTRHFDDHIRGAVVQPSDVPAFLRELRSDVR